MCASTTSFHEVYHKTWNLILGCENKGQLETARKYVDNLYRVFINHPELRFARENLDSLLARQDKLIH